MAGLLSRLGRKKSVHIWSAVVVAAGSARRMEGIDKVLTTLGELPVLVHTLRVFQQCPDIAEIVVVTREDLMVEVGSICQDFALTKVSKVIKGGKVIVRSGEVPHPVAVRYAWSDNPVEANLCDKDGLLASPFRTDDW